MPYEYHLVQASSVVIPPERQRKEIEEEEIEELAQSIHANTLLHPIVVQRNLELIVGERRLRAWLSLQKRYGEPYSLGIPCRFIDELSFLERKIIELEENVKRSNLSWQEESLAILQIHEMFEALDPEWTNEQTAQKLTCSKSKVSRACQVGEALRNEDKEVVNAAGVKSAAAVLGRKLKRQIHRDILTFGEVQHEREVSKAAASDTPGVVPELSSMWRSVEEDVLQVSFLEIAPAYDGPVYEFIHCDFPYGQSMHKTDQGSASTKETRYEDTEEVYYSLLECLLSNMDRLCSKVCHIMFWFPMKQYCKTVGMMQAAGLRVLPYPLVWHKADSVGIVPDVRREGRRTYETALVASRGDRQVFHTVANSFAWNRGRVEKHQSEKPFPVLSHFFKQFVDKDTALLDPTCGSGTALYVAEGLWAKRVTGWEINDVSVQDSRDLLQSKRMFMQSLGEK